MPASFALPDPPFTPVDGGVRVAVRLTPKASRDAITGFADEADGGRVLKASVTAVPENGKANAALIKLLSKAWKVPKSSLDVIQGATDRRKTLMLSGDAPALLRHLAPWAETLHG